MDEKDHTQRDPQPLSPDDVLLELAATRPKAKTNYLTESQIRYIIEGDTGSYNESDINGQVSKRAKKIPVRLKRLVYDVITLSSGGYLDSPDENWSALSNQLEEAHWPARYLLGRNVRNSTSNSEYQLGFTMGLILSEITGTVPDDQRKSDFLTGLTVAYATNDFYTPYQRSQDSDNQKPHRNKINDEIANTLESYGITPTPFLSYRIEMFKHGWGSMMGSSESLTLTEAAQKYLEDNLNDDFGKYSTLRRKLNSEWDTIHEASVPGIDAKEALEAFWNLDYHEDRGSKLNSTAIAKGMDKQSSYKKTVSNVFNKLSKEGRNPSVQLETTYEHAEIVKWDHSQWELTDYGNLLSYHIFEKNGEADWIQKIAAGANFPTEEYRAPTKQDKKILEKGFRSFYQE